MLNNNKNLNLNKKKSYHLMNFKLYNNNKITKQKFVETGNKMVEFVSMDLNVDMLMEKMN